MKRSHQIIGSGLVAVLALGLFTGCGDDTNAPLPPEPTGLPELTLDTPEAAATTMLRLLREERRTIAHRQKDASETALDALKKVASEAELKRILGDDPRFNSVVGEDLVLGYVRNWGATVSYYVEGIEFDKMRTTTSTDKRATILVPGSGKDGDAWIKLVVVHDDDGKWRVARIEYAADEAVKAAPIAVQATAPAESAEAAPEAP